MTSAPIEAHRLTRRFGSFVAIDGIDDVVLSHRFMDAADLLGRLTLAALEKPESVAVRKLADRFRATYLAVAGGDPVPYTITVENRDVPENFEEFLEGDILEVYVKEEKQRSIDD